MKKLSTTLLILLLTGSAMMLPLIYMTSICYTSPSPTVYLDPSDYVFDTNTASLGYRFNVTIWVTNVSKLMMFQVYITFNDSIINVTQVDSYAKAWPNDLLGGRAWDPEYVFFGATGGAIGNPTYYHLGAGQGAVKWGDTLAGDRTLDPSAAYKLARIEFTVTKMPDKGEILNCTLGIDNSDTYLYDSTGPIPDVTKQNGYYELAYAPPPPHLRLEAAPSSYEARKPRPFNVSVTIQNVSQNDYLIAVQFKVSYNSTCLKALNVTPGDFLSRPEWAPYGTVTTSYIEFGEVIYGEIIAPNATGYWNPPFPEGNGTLAIITFLPILHEEANFNITILPLFDEFFVNKDGEHIPYLQAKNCLYTYNPLPLPTIAVAPTEYISSYIGETFNINITLENLDEQWNMTYAEFKLLYCNTALHLLNVTEGDFLKQFGNTTFIWEELDGLLKMNITLTPTNGYPRGSGTLVTIAFNVTTSPGACALQLNETKLLDFEMKEVLHEVQSGRYELHEILVHPIVWNAEIYNITTVSNASVTPVPMEFDQPHMMLHFNVTGYNNTTGFVNVTIPKALLYASPTDWLIIVGGEPAVNVTIAENATHTSLYFTFKLSTKTVYILGTSVIPEMSSTLLMLILLTVTFIVFTATKKLWLKEPEKRVGYKTQPKTP